MSRWLQRKKALQIKEAITHTHTHTCAQRFFCVSTSCTFTHEGRAHQNTSGTTVEQRHFRNKSKALLICDHSILWRDVQFEPPLTVAADEGAGQQSHAGDGQQLQQPLPREQVIQRRHFGQHRARLDTDEVVRQETNEHWAEEEGDGDVYNRGWHVQKPVGCHGKESQEKQKEEQTVLVLLDLSL